MSINIVEDIRSVTELKRNTREVLDHVHRTGRPVVLTVNGRADAVLLDAETFEKYLRASNLSKLLMTAEQTVMAATATKNKAIESCRAKEFFREFRDAQKITG